MLKRFTLVILIGCFVSSYLAALSPWKNLTQFIIEKWTAEDGLPQSSVRTVLQTHDGYIWLGTQEGLARFNGVNFVVFNEENTPAITNNNIFSMFEDSRKNLWISTVGGGLLLYRNREFRRISTDDGLSHDYIYCVYEDVSGNIWIGTEGGGLNRWDEAADNFIVYNTESGLPSNEIRTMCEDVDHNLWIGTAAGLCCFKGGEFITCPQDSPSEGPAHEFINVLHRDSKNNLWIGTNRNLYLMRNGALVDHYIKTIDSTIDVKAIYEDRNQSLWIATENSGIIRYRDGKSSFLDEEKGLLSKMVLGITEDREGSIWLGTSLGLNCLKEGKFTTITTKEGLSNNLIFAIFEDSKGYLWIGTDKGLNRYKDGLFMYFTTKNGLSHPSVAAIYEDSKGYIWVGTDGGLDKLSNHPHKITKIKSYLKGEYIPAVMEDKEGNIWVGTLGGAVILKKGRLEWHTGKNLLGKSTINFIYKDSRKDLWFSALRRGIARYKDGKFTFFNKENGLAGDSVNCMHEDRQSVYWIGTDGGLSCFQDGKFFNYTKKDGLFHNNISFILEDKQENLWMSTNRGIFCISKENLFNYTDGKADKLEVEVYDQDDGMRNKECNSGNQSAGCKTTDGKLWFPTVMGAVYIDPENIIINKNPPPVHIEKVFMDDVLSPSSGTVFVQPEVKRLEIHYSALSFINPLSVRFKYRLEGYDEQLINAENERKALYTNLDPGSYNFHVIAANNDDVWNKEGASINIEVIPHFSNTWWFRAITLIIFGLLSYLIIHFFIKYITLSKFWKKQKYIGNFKILETIGSGGMGTIYKAKSLLEKSKIVALKVLREDMFADENSRKRFKHEAAIIDQLDHPNIVKVIERGEVKQNLFMAMEYLQGDTLTKKINEDKKITIREALHIMIQIADAIAKIHSKNIIHRDLKPDNIMLINRRGNPNFVKLLDFGLAKTQYQTRLTQTGVVIGTINYLAPEQVAGKESNASGDIYSLGILFYEIITGEKPFIGETTIDIMKQIMDKTPIEPIRFREDVPIDLNHLIMKMLAKDRKARPIIYDVVSHLKAIEYSLHRSKSAIN